MPVLLKVKNVSMRAPKNPGFIPRCRIFTYEGLAIITAINYMIVTNTGTKCVFDLYKGDMIKMV